MRLSRFWPFLSILLTAPGEAREQIRAVGSATVFPFAAAAAEHFGEQGRFRTPIVEAIGTGGGIALFCRGTGAGSTADFANASRPMKPAERENCARHGVRRIIEIPLGYDGIVLAEGKTDRSVDLTLPQLFLALMKTVPKDGRLVANPYRRWNQISSALPDRPILIYGPASGSGTRDTLVDLVSEAGCGLPEYKAAYPEEKSRKEACTALREDGAFIPGREDYNAVVMKLKANTNAFGIFGYSYLEQNAGKLRAARIDGIAPSEKTIADGQYKLARMLYTYAKGENLGIIPGMTEFAGELVGEEATGPEGYLTLQGLIPFTAEYAEKSRRQVIEAMGRH